MATDLHAPHESIARDFHIVVINSAGAGFALACITRCALLAGTGCIF
jgi:hypothetical protein